MKQFGIISTLIGTMAICSSLIAAEVNPDKSVIADGSVAAPNQKLARQMGATILAGYCDAVLPPNQNSAGTLDDQSEVAQQTPRTEDLHRCQYIRETASCLGDSACPSYEDWTQINAEISPQLPRAVFLDALEKHQKRLQVTRAN